MRSPGLRRACRFVLAVALVGAALLAPLPAPPAGAAPTWELAWLQPLPGRPSTAFYDANEVGVAVGSSLTPLLAGFDAIPTAWDRSGNAYPLGLPAGFRAATAYAINDLNVAVGVGFPEGESTQRSIVWRPGQAPQVLGPDDFVGFPVEVLNSEPPLVVNSLGEVHEVGGSHVQLPGDGSQVVPRAAQRRGTQGLVVGHLLDAGTTRAVLWTDAGVHPLAPSWTFDTTASSIAGYLVGVNYSLDDEPVVSCSAATLHLGTTVMPLDPAADSSTVADITSFGIAVGTRTADGCGAGEGVLWAYGTPVPIRTLAGVEHDLQPAEVTEDLTIYGGGFILRRTS